MANGQYIGVNGVARKVTAPYIGVEGVARKVTNGYVGVDGVARLFFAPEGGTVVLEVAKQTLTTYSGETSYADENFILLDIYPKSASSKVNVTYGSLTKTLTFSGTNAQQVYFGTFNGISDSVDTPSSGTLTIEGGCIGVGCGTYQNGTKTTNTGTCPCITAVNEWGGITTIPANAFSKCSSLTSISIPDGVDSIGNYAFNECSNLARIELPNSVTSIGNYAFYNCKVLALSELPSGIISIGNYAFWYCETITLHSLPNGITGIGDYAFYRCDGIVFNASFFGSKITSIGNHAFYRYDKCSADIVLPNTLTTVGDSAFAYHRGYAEGSSGYGNGINGTIKLLSTTPPTITVDTTSGSFGGSGYISNLTFVVQKGSKSTYTADSMWSAYSSYIVEAT